MVGMVSEKLTSGMATKAIQKYQRDTYCLALGFRDLFDKPH